ncbi:MAG: transglycosylase domain-containing protein [Chloroflexi bacterium]|nr:transglycosylase domain-containing protein [Chloroflexota bacterium]
MASLLGIGLLSLVGGAAWLLAGLPSTESLVTRASPDSTKIFDRHGALLYELLDPRAGRRSRVALAELPPELPAAVIAVEDAGFYANPGIEARGVARAVWQMARERRVVSGGSTITQQLARQLLLSPGERVQRSLRRKLREMLLALAITRRYPKDQILELYLNEVYFGQLAYGVDAASRTYFGKPARALDLAESALLAGLIQSPAAYNPLVDWDAARARQSVVLDLMVKAGLAEPQAAELARAEPLHLAGGNVPLEAPHFVSWVQSRLELRYGAERVSAGGLNVITSLDLDLQRAAEAIVRRRIAELARREPGKPDHQASDAALVAISPETGQVLALVGSADYFDASIDGAVNVALALRQPGSSIKPLTYATAFDVGRWGLRPPGPDPSRPRLPFSPATVLLDLPTSFVTREGEPYRPQNYDRSWHGPIGLRRALATSSNLVAVKVLEAVGVDALIDSAEALGIGSLHDRERYGLALTLGGGEVRLLELTAAYAGLAAGGRRVQPEPILAVLDAKGLAELQARDPGFERLHRLSSVASRPALDPRAAWLVTDILADDAARLPAFGEASVLALDRPAAAKTGTTTDFRDNWTLGYTPDLAVGVWLGNADGRPMRWISGISGAGPIWQDLMLRAHRGLPRRDFLRPEGLRRVEICEAGGLLPGEACRRRRAEWFVAGSEPRDLDPSYQAIEVEAHSGLPWSEGCAGQPTRRVFRVLPAEALDWARRAGIEPSPERDCRGRPFRLALQPESAGLPESAASSAALRLDSPVEGSTFALSPRLPRAAQRLELRALALTDQAFAGVRLELDGRVLARPSRPPYRTDWQLEPGRHEARAVAETVDGRQLASEVVRFDVVEEAEIE